MTLKNTNSWRFLLLWEVSRGNALFSRPQKLADGVLNQVTVQVKEALVAHFSLCPTLRRPQAFLLSLCQEKKKHLCSVLPRGHIPRTPCDFHKFSFFFFCFVSIKPSGALKRSLTLFQVFFLKAKDECPGKEPCQTPQGHGMLGI